MSDDEVIKFEITDQDLESEFNLNTRRNRLTKNQQIYGIWATDSDDEQEPTSSRRTHFQSNTKGKQSYRTPVTFVAGGIQQAGKKKEAGGTSKKDDIKTEEVDDENEIPAGSSSEEESLMPRAGFGQKKYNKRRPLAQPHELGEIDADIAGMRRRPAAGSLSMMQKGVGGWERHTKGIGAKLLLQMGFQPGKGLGRNLQGISTPVEATVRKGRAAIGAYGPERNKKQPGKADSEEDEAKEFSEKLSQWRKKDAGPKKQKVKYIYKTVDQVVEEGKGKAGPSIKDYAKMSKVKVIDMTGPEQRVLTGYHAIAGQQKPTEEWDSRKDYSYFDLPELTHNLDLLVTMCEQDIVVSTRRVRHNQDRSVILEQEIETLGNVIESQAAQIDSLEECLNLIELLNETPLTLDRAANVVQQLKERHSTEYMIHEIGSTVASLVSGMLKNILNNWDPLDDPKHPVALTELNRWQKLLEGEKSHKLSSAAAKDPYHHLIWEGWVPSVQRAVLNWDCRKSKFMIRILETWKGTIPNWILNSIIEQSILPRLKNEVELWDPLTDTVPIHEWLHPWIPYAKDDLAVNVYPIIRRKLSVALTAWHPSDRSAKLMLKPWKNVFPSGDMDAFLFTNILPKLQTSMQELVINPHQQHLDQWNWVMEWEDLLPIYTLATLLEKIFFPKWIQVLTVWLTHNPNYDEIARWYRGWKGMISEQLLAQPNIKGKLNDALQLMNRAAVAVSQNLPVTFVPAPTPQNVIRREELMAEAVKTASQIPQGFRELLQKRCEERGILFVPVPNRWYEGKQVYRCGNVFIYLDRSVIFVSRANTNIWTPTNMHSVIDMALQ